MLDESEIKELINEVLYQNDLISKDVYEKCGKPHISSLPGNLRSNDMTLLNNRFDACEENIKKQEDIIYSLHNETYDLMAGFRNYQELLSDYQRRYEDTGDDKLKKSIGEIKNILKNDERKLRSNRKRLEKEKRILLDFSDELVNTGKRIKEVEA